jgi:hypothetical protein
MNMKTAILGAVLMAGIGQIGSLAQAAERDGAAPSVRSSTLVQLAQMQAPVGHRQPTQNDIPPAVRQDEAPGAEASPPPDARSGARGGQLNDRPSSQPDGVPRICDRC